MTIDGQYSVGFSFARQYGLRLTKDINPHISVALAIENAQGTLTSHNNTDNYLLGEVGATNEMNAFNGTYTANPSPDVIAKIAFDQGSGHYEIFGLADRFADRVFPCVEPGTNPVCTGTTATGAYNASKEGGGFGFNARWTMLDKHLVFGLHEFGGTGIGRYGAAGLSDISIHANGTLNLIRDYQGLGTLEYHGKKLDVYSYAGVEYAGRTYDFDPNENAAVTGPVGYVGYGAPEFSNAGCYTETAPGGHGHRGIQSRRARPLHRRHAGGHGGYARLLVPLLQRAQGQVPVRHAVLLRDPSHLVWRSWTGNFRVAFRNR